MPRIYALLTFSSGVILLASGATPGVTARLHLLSRLVPLGVLEASHFAGSIVGTLLMVLGHGLRRQLESAYRVTLTLYVIGAVASLLKGIDYEEALLLMSLAVALVQRRRHFYKQGDPLSAGLTSGWLEALVLAVFATTCLGVFAHRHIAYAPELWWQFTFFGDASRFLRAEAGVATLLVTVTAAQLILGPEWRPRYLASPGGLDLPMVLASAAALVSKGLRGAVSR